MSMNNEPEKTRDKVTVHISEYSYSDAIGMRMLNVEPYTLVLSILTRSLEFILRQVAPVLSLHFNVILPSISS